MYDDQSITPPQLPTEPDAAETNETEPFNSSSPAISVIIPLYNAEDYLGECIDGILAQTFQDFELIIVDDCSTDSSCEIVESYIPKFDGRLKLYHTPKNTGSGVIARNIGLSYASGEYVYNMDNDDLITETALEEMYKLAREYDADVVYCERYYMSSGVGKNFTKDIYLAKGKIQKPPYVEEPTLEPEDLLKFGMIPELVGRLPVVATLHPLDEKALIQVLTEPKNALVKQYKKTFKIDNVDLDFTEDALHTVAQLAIKKESGARGLRGILENAMMPFMYAVPGMDNLDKLTITSDIIRRQGDLKQIDELLNRGKVVENAADASKIQAKPADPTPAEPADPTPAEPAPDPVQSSPEASSDEAIPETTEDSEVPGNPEPKNTGSQRKSGKSRKRKGGK